jgi:multiple sugar transport system substrate-binding protein
MFGQGKAAMVLDGNWAIPYLQETFPRISFAIAPVPTINGKKGTMAFTVAYVMNKQSTHKEEAWELISYLTGKEGMKAWASGGLILPTRKSVLAELGYPNNPLYAPFVAGADYATLWQAGENLSLINQNFNNQFLSALLGEQSLAEAMKKAQATANQEIKASLY